MGKISFKYITAPRVSSIVVNLEFKCSNEENLFFTLNKLKKGYATNDSQFKQGGECVALCYSLYQMLLNKTKETYNGAKFPINCIKCCAYNKKFIISFLISNTANSIKRGVKIVLKHLVPLSAWKWYQINIKNLQGSADKDKFNWAVSKLNESLLDISIIACGKIKLPKEKEKDMVKYWTDNLPKLKKKGKVSKPVSRSHTIPEEKSHFMIKTKNTLGIDSVLTANYIQKTLGVKCVAVSPTSVLVWNKNLKGKLKSIKNKNRIKRELLAKKSTNDYIVYGVMESCNADNSSITKFINSKASDAKIVTSIYNSL